MLRSDGSCTTSWSTPPTSVPTAMPAIARAASAGSTAGRVPPPSVARMPERNPGASHHAAPRPPMIEPRLKKADAAAGTPKRLRVLRMPIATAASATRSRNGNMMRVRLAVSADFPGMAANPGAIASTSDGASQIPSRQSPPTITAIALVTRLARRHAAASPSRSKHCVNVLTNAAESAPSANRSRSRFGMRKAVMNASSSRPAPKQTANTCSRTTPSTRLAATAMLTTPARRASPRPSADPRPTASSIRARRYVRRARDATRIWFPPGARPVLARYARCALPMPPDPVARACRLAAPGSFHPACELGRARAGARYRQRHGEGRPHADRAVDGDVTTEQACEAARQREPEPDAPPPHIVRLELAEEIEDGLARLGGNPGAGVL